MNTNINITRKQNLLMTLIILFNFLAIYSCSTQAQSFKEHTYIGLEASFGSRSFEVTSAIAKINHMKAIHGGGSLGFVFGNEALRSRVTVAGVYYSDGNTPYTQQLFEANALTNFYPLELTPTLNKARLQPYITTGLGMTNTRFYGSYLENQVVKSGYEQFLGKVSLINAKGGLGVEYQLINNIDFVHVFAEVQYGCPLIYNASNKTFSNTRFSNFTSVNLGVSFGMRR